MGIKAARRIGGGNQWRHGSGSAGTEGGLRNGTELCCHGAGEGGGGKERGAQASSGRLPETQRKASQGEVLVEGPSVCDFREEN